MDQKTLWISHRGYKESNVENTIGAFDKAVSLGFTALETDLRLSRDGHIVLAHDSDLSRISGQKQLIQSLTKAELSELKLSDGSGVLFFDQFIEKYRECSWTLDIKPETGPDTIAALAKWANDNNAVDWFQTNVRFLLWSRSQEKLLLEAFPVAKFYAQKPECWRAGVLTFLGIPSLGGIKAGRTYSLTSHFAGFSIFRREIVKAFHDRGARVVAYLPDDEFDAKKAVQAGFDEVLTNGKKPSNL